MKDNVDIRTKDDSDILTLTCFSPQSTHSVTKTWFAQSVNIVPALEATRPLRKVRLDLFAPESPSLQGEFKRNTTPFALIMGKTLFCNIYQQISIDLLISVRTRQQMWVMEITSRSPTCRFWRSVMMILGLWWWWWFLQWWWFCWW